MLIQEITASECLNILARTRVGRLGCAHEDQPYVVPISFVYEAPYLYGFTTMGQKVEWMRSNPLVCVELDEIVNSAQWMSVVIFGHYEELLDTPESDERWNHHRISRFQDNSDIPTDGQERRHAHKLLHQYAGWWETGSVSSTLRNREQPLECVFYRICIDKITGRRATPDPGGPVTLRKPSRAGESHVWLSGVFHALFKPWRAMKRSK
jgi:nitroimidazol reductase NimA-like FMN-containing flavoprotein (pyridoxamine 5'-phosphate oxidase superfamily)